MNILTTVETEKYTRQLKRLGGTYLPDAIADALNEPARLIAAQAKVNAKRHLIIRKQYSTNSIRQFGFARGRNINRMYSLVGSNSDYLWKHNAGAKIKAKSRKVPIPTLRSRGNNIRKSIRRKYAMNQLGNLDGRGGRYFAGRPRGLNRPVGIYERTNSNHRLKMLRNLESSSVKIPRTNWYTAAYQKYGTQEVMANAFIRSAKLKLNMMPE